MLLNYERQQVYLSCSHHRLRSTVGWTTQPLGLAWGVFHRGGCKLPSLAFPTLQPPIDDRLAFASLYVSVQWLGALQRSCIGESSSSSTGRKQKQLHQLPVAGAKYDHASLVDIPGHTMHELQLLLKECRIWNYGEPVVSDFQAAAEVWFKIG